MTTEAERNIAQKIANAIVEAIRPLIGDPDKQYEIAALLDEDPSTLSKLLGGRNSNVARALGWLEKWNSNPLREDKLVLLYDGSDCVVKVKRELKKAKKESASE